MKLYSRQISWILYIGIHRLMTTVAIFPRVALSEFFTSLCLSSSIKTEQMCELARLL